MDDGEGATASYMKGPAMARILCVDNYDSFVFTIVGYLRHLGAVVDVVRNDVVDPAWFEAGYDGVLISPGPGDPKSAGTSLQTIADCAEREIPSTESGIIMGVRHRSLPLEGVQFHPESVMTQSGHLMFANWLAACGDADARERAVSLKPVVAERFKL